jgi:hypothetical protein
LGAIGPHLGDDLLHFLFGDLFGRLALTQRAQSLDRLPLGKFAIPDGTLKEALTRSAKPGLGKRASWRSQRVF